MDLVKCNNNHYYDKHRFHSCPHCAEIYSSIPSIFKKLGKCSKIANGSTCSVFEIVGKSSYILKAINCETDEKYKNALYELNILKRLKEEKSVVQMIDFEIVKSQRITKVYILMKKYITISKFASSNTVTAKDAVSWILQLSKALKKCVDLGVLHLDVSPKNIYLNEFNEVVLGDFGSSLLFKDVIHNNSMRGTLDYIAPEVYRNGECSELSDLYSVGLIFYKFFNSGKLPFTDSNSHEISIYKRLAGTPMPSLHYPNDNVEIIINQIIEGTCSFEKQNRFRNYETLISRLEKLYEILYDNRVLNFEDNHIDFNATEIAGWSPSLPRIEQIDNDAWDNDDVAHSVAYSLASSIILPPPKQKSSGVVHSSIKSSFFDADETSLSLPLPQNTGNSTADAIAVLREQLAGSGEIMINSDEIVMDASNPCVPYSHTDGDDFKPVDKAVVAGGDYEGYIRVPNGKLAGGHGMCRICGTIFKQATNFCPECGTKTAIDKPRLQLDEVFFSAIAPKTLLKGDYSIIDIYMYEKEFRHVVDKIIKEADNNVEEKKTSGVIEAERDAKITVVLSSKDIEIDDNREEQIWHGKYLNFSFAIELPDNYAKKQILFISTVYVNDVIATRLKFIVKCKSFLEQKIQITREDVTSAFVSYASQDRKRVAMIIQGMRKARPDMDIFFDVDSLRSGDNWEKALWKEIDSRDLLYLCWSKFARDSKWVNAEWHYALEHKGIECIEPVPIDPPSDCPPPQELNQKHFNDRMLYFINSKNMFEEQSVSLFSEWD